MGFGKRGLWMAHVDDALEHVGYEWWMFRELFALLDGLPDAPDPVRNALLESLAIHGRVLGRFFTTFTSRRREKFNAEDFGLEIVSEPAVMTEWRQEMNGRVAHLLKQRVDPKGDWKAVDVRAFLDARIQAFKTQLGGAVAKDWIGDARVRGSALIKERPPSANVTAGASGIFGGTAAMDVTWMGAPQSAPGPQGATGPGGKPTP